MTPYSLVCSYWRCRGTYCLPTFSHNHPEDGSSVSPKRWDPPTWLYIVLMEINKRISMYIKASDLIICNSVSWTAFQKHFVMKWCMLYKCSCIREMCKAACYKEWYSVLLGARTAKSVQWLCYGLEVREIVVRLPARARDFSLLQSVRSVTGAHPIYYSAVTEGARAEIA